MSGGSRARVSKESVPNRTLRAAKGCRDRCLQRVEDARARRAGTPRIGARRVNEAEHVMDRACNARAAEGGR